MAPWPRGCLLAVGFVGKIRGCGLDDGRLLRGAVNSASSSRAYMECLTRHTPREKTASNLTSFSIRTDSKESLKCGENKQFWTSCPLHLQNMLLTALSLAKTLLAHTPLLVQDSAFGRLIPAQPTTYAITAKTLPNWHGWPRPLLCTSQTGTRWRSITLEL